MSTVNILSTIIAVVFGIGALICWIISIFTYKEIKSKILGIHKKSSFRFKQEHAC